MLFVLVMGEDGGELGRQPNGVVIGVWAMHGVAKRLTLRRGSSMLAFSLCGI